MTGKQFNLWAVDKLKTTEYCWRGVLEPCVPKMNSSTCRYCCQKDLDIRYYDGVQKEDK